MGELPLEVIVIQLALVLVVLGHASAFDRGRRDAETGATDG
jgi:hypothetical protein